ncbi:acyl carrier protein [Anaeroselena agilis]|uniref:Phosphopantetheine-binding protein n=1 Tax=Anaeroselena agilis TaxID=3063788 RepID=A0ABU3P3J8_9FIRM|nr:phosphopantetheine-binding protein [Selenomonadales bacterium 4137-cl]
MSTIEKLREVILKLRKKNITADKLTPDARFAQDLDFDSQDLTEMLVLAEDAFKVSLDLQEVKNLSTIAAAVEFLDKKQAK